MLQEGGLLTAVRNQGRDSYTKLGRTGKKGGGNSQEGGFRTYVKGGDDKELESARTGGVVVERYLLLY